MVNGIDQFYTDRMPQYETITSVHFGNWVITVERRSSEYKTGPDPEVTKQVEQAYDMHQPDFRKVSVSISALKGVSKVTVLNCQKNGASFRYLYS